MKPKVFFSHGFNEGNGDREKKEEKIVNFWEGLLNEVFDSENVIAGKKPTEISVIKKTLKRIDECSILFVVFPRRSQLKSGGYNTSSNIVSETGYALGKGIPVFGVREEGVAENEVGMALFFSLDFPVFRSRLDLLKANKDYHRKFIEEGRKLVGEDNAFPCSCEEALKEVIVCQNGFGKIRCAYKIKFIKDKKGDISLNHGLSLGDSAKKGSKLLSLDIIRKQNPHKAVYEAKYFFNCQVTKGLNTSVSLVLLKQSIDEIKFNLVFKGDFKTGQEIEYEYIIGGPDLFSVNSFDLEKGKRTKDLSYVISNFFLNFADISNLTYIIKFEKGVDSLSQKPTFEYFSEGGDSMGENGKPSSFTSERKGAYYTTYQRKDNDVKYSKGNLVAIWKPL